MTLDEKLDNFYNATMEDAAKQRVEIINDYKKSLREIYEEHKQESLRKAENFFEMEVKNLNREKNKTLSTETLDMRRLINEKSKELSAILFNDVTRKIEEFMKTPEYIDLLEKQIRDAVNFSKQDAITIYINPSDEEKKAELEKRTNALLTISTIDFLGGTRAVISSKNILIDNSFSTKINEEKEKFELQS
ncbi:vacuolar-type H+-ATPase subunit E/Vma4 [Mobilisporobacter senegalensis]|uniref:Vacuolar-type H+-ATPase subunit E/Vma4 n=1 Tax=Mobilisporobacter senegalensis TaxID=1329262 RepID=A0A3N1XB14_9FIRM|nr:V-type ATP synthase subunit E [Mobilisporobacter senegalensis]ROR22152.1 vacuolar-type H+-ATPase subunit E/Vma4 [Mobilisporobacter senegalensis]